MCKFHKTVAREIATIPFNQQFDPARYAVALVALSTFRIEQKMPAMFGCDGYSKYEMATATARKALDQAHLQTHDTMMVQDMQTLHRAIDTAARAVDISITGLNLPKNPVKDTAFLDEATVQLFDGYTAPGYASALLRLKPLAHKPDFEPLRAAAAIFMAQPDVMAAMQRRFENTTLNIFTHAQNTAHPGLVHAYEYVPERLRKIFKSCSTCMGGGAGGAAVSHVGCIAIPTLAAASGTAVSSAAMAGIMMVTAPVIAAGMTYGFDKARGMKATTFKVAGSAVFAFAIAAGVSTIGGGHEDHSHHNIHGTHDLPPYSYDESSMCRTPRPQ